MAAALSRDRPAPDLEDVHLAGTQLGKLNLVSQGQAAFEQVILPAGNRDLDKKVLPAGILDGLTNHQGEPGPVLDGAAELIGAFIGQGGEKTAREHEPVGHVHEAHVKAQRLGQLGLLGIGLHHLVEQLLWGGLAVFRLGSIPGHEFAEHAVRGIIPLDNVHIREHQITGLGTVVVDHVRHLGEHMLVLPLVDIQGQGVGVVGLDRVVPLAGDHRRPCLSLVGIVGDEGLRGPFLRGLDEMGVGGSGDQPVAEHHVIDLHRG